jgi:3-hydroxybutyryl-CoA dehydratase
VPETAAQTAPAREFESFRVGDRAVLSRRITEQDVAAFAAFSGDYNPLHMDSAFAGRTRFGHRVVHGMVVASLVSTVIGMQLPGTGALWVQQTFRWRKPVFVDDTVEIMVEIAQVSPGGRLLSIRVAAVNQEGTVVMDGEGVVHVPRVEPTQNR